MFLEVNVTQIWLFTEQDETLCHYVHKSLDTFNKPMKITGVREKEN